MAKSVTLETMISDVRLYADQRGADVATDGFVTDAEITRLLNLELASLTDLLISCQEQDYYLEDDTISIVAGTSLTITLKDVYQNLVGFQCTMMAAADDLDMYAQAGDYDLAAKTFIVRFKTGATDTQPPAANANNQLSVTLTFADSRIV